jgi:hypothetical protein
MRVYSTVDEEALRDRELVRGWADSGFLDSAQKTLLLDGLKTDLRQTNGFLRAVLFFFTALIVLAGVGLLTVNSGSHDAFEFGAICMVSGLSCAALAELACRGRFYRFGAEEALGVSAVVLLSISLTSFFESPGSSAPNIAGLLVATFGSVVLYFRFGFVYAAVGSVVCAAAIPFKIDASSDAKRLLAAIIVAGILVIARRTRLGRRETPAGSASEAVEAASWFVVYVVINVQLTASIFAISPGVFYPPTQHFADASRNWFFFLSWAAVWVLPAVGLWLGLRRKDRLVIVANLAAALLTLSTNKRYLGWPIHAWDPMLFGILLMTTAILLRRWLQRGPNGDRHGFTADRILRSDERVLAAVSIASAAIQPHLATRPAGEPRPERLHEGGGKSGGGGATGNF